eukprot:452613-Hanusia_phi.AAC.2
MSSRAFDDVVHSDGRPLHHPVVCMPGDAALAHPVIWLEPRLHMVGDRLVEVVDESGVELVMLPASASAFAASASASASAGTFQTFMEALRPLLQYVVQSSNRLWARMSNHQLHPGTQSPLEPRRRCQVKLQQLYPTTDRTVSAPCTCTYNLSLRPTAASPWSELLSPSPTRNLCGTTTVRPSAPVVV